MADKYIQLQSADGTDNLFPITMSDENLLWTNGSPKVAITFASITLAPPRVPRYLIIEYLQYGASSTLDYYCYTVLIPNTWTTMTSIRYDGSTNLPCEQAMRYDSATGVLRVENAYYGTAWNSLSGSSGYYLIPERVWAIY